jgi:hypothetical protein|tara:strand:- start:3289 stop:3477 length:189 start_codon:yes stop_codon:yes gene_type:complete
MAEIWQYEKLKREPLSRDGSKRNGRMFARAKRVGVARERNGVLHIAAPPSGYLLRPLKPPKK